MSNNNINYTNRNGSSSPVPSLAFTDMTSDTNNSTSRHSTLQKVIRGIGELDDDTAHNHQRHDKMRFLHAERKLIQLQQDLDLPYLLLDLRDRDEYDQSHIISALNYPNAMLSRSINNETPEMLAYKNQPGKIILVYDDDERIAPKAATTLVQRGYDNLFLLSGGLKLAFRKFPQGLITGQVPASFMVKTPKPSGASSMTNRSVLSAFGGGDYSNINNNNNNYPLKRTFDHDDIEKLNSYLEESLLLNDATSRLSRATNKSSRMSAVSNGTATTTNASVSSARTLTSIHEKPWKPY